MSAAVAQNTLPVPVVRDSDSDSDSDDEPVMALVKLQLVEEAPAAAPKPVEVVEEEHAAAAAPEVQFLAPEIDYDGLTQTISDLCAEVMAEMGPYHSEGIYQSCLQHELTQKGILSVREVTQGLIYKGIPIGDNQNVREDLYLPQYKCVLELKAAKLSDKEEGQLRKYLLQNDTRNWGMCINFRTMDSGRSSVEYVRMIKTAKTTVFNKRQIPILHRDPMVTLDNLYPDNAVIFDIKPPEKTQVVPQKQEGVEEQPVATPVNKGKCGICNKMFTLTKNGTIRHHNIDGKKENGACLGVGKPPLEAD